MENLNPQNILNENPTVDENLLEQQYMNNLPENMSSLLLFEDLVWDLPKFPENFQKASSMIHLFPPNYIQLLIQYIASTTFLGYKQLGDFFELTLPCLIKFDKNEPFSCYLLARKIISPSDFLSLSGPPRLNGLLKPISYYEHPIKENSIWYYVWKDDVAKVKQFFEEHISKHSVYAFTFSWNETLIFTLSSFAAYFNSLEVIKFLSTQDFKFTYHQFFYAIKGGSINAINFIQNNMPTIQWDYASTMVAIETHQNTLARLSYRIGDEHTRPILPICAHSFNTASLLYFLHVQKLEINEIDSSSIRTCTLIAKSECQNQILYDYLVSHGGKEAVFIMPTGRLDETEPYINPAPLLEDEYNEEEMEEEEYFEDIVEIIDPNDLPHEGDLY